MWFLENFFLHSCRLFTVVKGTYVNKDSSFAWCGVQIEKLDGVRNLTSFICSGCLPVGKVLIHNTYQQILQCGRARQFKFEQENDIVIILCFFSFNELIRDSDKVVFNCKRK